MKKSIVYSTILAASLLTVSAGTAVVYNSAAAPATDNLVATADTLSAPATTKIMNSKDETVYIIADASGAAKTKYIGNSLYTGSEELPYTMSVRYYLDGAEISPTDLAGKSGHVKIVYDYTSNAWYNGVRIPFLAVTGITFDSAKFSNLKLTNGKIMSEGDSYMVAGYSLLGVNETFGTDLLPSEFTVEADVNNFALGTTYTVLINDIFADIDTARLSDVDGLASSVNQLATGLDQIISGAGDLSNGLTAAATGADDLSSGANDLAAGITDAATGAKQIVGGLQTVTANNATLQGGADAMIAATLAKVNAATSALGVTVTAENYETTLSQIIATVGATSETGASLTEAYKTLSFALGVKAYTAGVAEISAGASDLATGLDYMNGKMSDFTAGANDLAAGLAKLSTGSDTLSSGLGTFKTSGIDRLVKFANNDLSSFTRNARRLVTAAASYKSYGDANAESVKFVIKTTSIK